MARRPILSGIVGASLGSLVVISACVLASIWAFAHGGRVTVPMLWEVWAPTVHGMKEINFVPNFLGFVVYSLGAGLLFAFGSVFVGRRRVGRSAT